MVTWWGETCSWLPQCLFSYPKHTMPCTFEGEEGKAHSILHLLSNILSRSVENQSWRYSPSSQSLLLWPLLPPSLRTLLIFPLPTCLPPPLPLALPLTSPRRVGRNIAVKVWGLPACSKHREYCCTLFGELQRDADVCCLTVSFLPGFRAHKRACYIKKGCVWVPSWALVEIETRESSRRAWLCKLLKEGLALLYWHLRKFHPLMKHRQAE